MPNISAKLLQAFRNQGYDRIGIPKHGTPQAFVYKALRDQVIFSG